MSVRSPLIVGLASRVPGLRDVVHCVFSRSLLATSHELRLVDIRGAETSLETEIVLADPGEVADLLGSIRGLRWLQSTWAGVNVLSRDIKRNYLCTRLGGCFGAQMAEYVFGAIFFEDWASLSKQQAELQWSPEPFRVRPRLDQMMLGCLGVGDISSVVGKRAQAFGMRTLGYGTRVREVLGFDRVTTDLDEILDAADVIVNVLPSTTSTRGLLDGRLHACGSGKLFINVGRGDVVSESCLLEALEVGWLRRVALDVFVEEPLPCTSRLWRHPAVQVTPHIAAITCADDVASLFVENLSLWMEGKPLRFVVDLDRGY